MSPVPARLRGDPSSGAYGGGPGANPVHHRQSSCWLLWSAAGCRALRRLPAPAPLAVRESWRARPPLSAWPAICTSREAAIARLSHKRADLESPSTTRSGHAGAGVQQTLPRSRAEGTGSCTSGTPLKAAYWSRRSWRPSDLAFPGCSAIYRRCAAYPTELYFRTGILEESSRERIEQHQVDSGSLLVISIETMTPCLRRVSSSTGEGAQAFLSPSIPSTVAQRLTWRNAEMRSHQPVVFYRGGRQLQICRMPRRRAMVTACVRSLAWSLSTMFLM